jgi:hypothetical protein
MTLKLHPEMLVAAYEYLRTTEPFKAWNLPHSDDVGFHVVKTSVMSADFSVENGMPIIRVSLAKNGHTNSLMETMAHEMIHLRQHLTKDREVHGRRFQKMAARVCKAHGFDPLTF